MHWHDCGYRASTTVADELARSIPRALIFQMPLQHLDGHVVSIFVDVDEFGRSSGLRDRFCCRNKCMWHGQYNVAGLYAASHNCKAQSIRTTANRNRMSGAAEGCKCSLKILHHRAAYETSSVQSSTEHANEFSFKL